MQASPSTQIPRIQDIAAYEQSHNQEPLCCQLWCFGRTVSVSSRTAVILSTALFAGCAVGASVAAAAGPPLLAALGSDDGAVVTTLTGLAAGVGASILAGFLANNVHAKCRHVAPSVAPVQLSRVISHAPEASGAVLAEIFCPGNDTTFSPNFPELPPYSPELPPPLYSSQEALGEQCPSGGGHSS